MEDINLIPQYDNEDDLKYYDFIIDINSFKTLSTEGWRVRAKQKGLEKYKIYSKEKKLPVIGVIGNRNVGKSYLLQKITGNEVPVGFSVDTKGLSICYPSINEKNFVMMDTAGFQSPLLNYKKNKKKQEKENDEKETEESIKIKEEKKSKLIENALRDKKMINIFLESFIIKNSDILIYVLNQITKSDQMFLDKIKKNLEDKNKSLIVVHNLKNFVTLEQCDYYVKNYLMNNLGFNLEELNYKDLFLNNEKEETENQKVMLFKEKEMNKIENENNFDNYDTNPSAILHIIMANDNNTEAGKHYNNKVIEFIHAFVTSYTNIKPFDIIDKVIKHLYDKQNDIFSKKIPEKGIIIDTGDENNDIHDKNFEWKESYEKEFCRIKFKNYKVKLKRVIEDYLGNETFIGDVIVPHYRDYLKKASKTKKEKETNNTNTETTNDEKTEEEEEKDKYIVEFELPGKFNFEKKKKKKDDENDNNEEKKEEEKKKEYDKWDLKIGKKPDKAKGDVYYIIIISGEKKPPNSISNPNDNRKYGKFKLIVRKIIENFELEDKDNPEIVHKSGVHQYIWNIKYKEIKTQKPAEEIKIKINKKKKEKKKIEKPTNTIEEKDEEEKEEEEK
jgi:hypothetical protein